MSKILHEKTLFTENGISYIFEAEEETEGWIPEGGVYFIARVSAVKAGIELAYDYLGACHYYKYEDFYANLGEDYIADMLETVKSAALAKLVELAN